MGLGESMGAVGRSTWQSTLLCAVLLFCAYLRFDFKATMDLMPTYLAAEFAARGEWEHVYHPTVYIQGNADPEWTARMRELGLKNSGTSFTSHPYYLALAVPVVEVLDAGAFRQVVTILNILLVVWIALELAWLLGLTAWGDQVALTLVVGFATPSTVAIHLGQNTLLALALCLAAQRTWRSTRSPWIGGALVALAIVCKPWCVLLFGPFALLRKLRTTLTVFLACAVVLWALPYALFPKRLMADYASMNAELSKLSLFAPNNHAILATLDRVRSPDWVPNYLAGGVQHPSGGLRLWALSIGGLIALLVAVPFVRSPRSHDWLVTCGMALMIVPLGVSWNHYFVFALPLALLLSFGRPDGVWLRVLGVLFLAFLMALESLIKPFIELTRESEWSPGSLALLTGVPMLVLAAMTVLAAWSAPTFQRPQIQS